MSEIGTTVLLNYLQNREISFMEKLEHSMEIANYLAAKGINDKTDLILNEFCNNLLLNDKQQRDVKLSSAEQKIENEKKWEKINEFFSQILNSKSINNNFVTAIGTTITTSTKSKIIETLQQTIIESDLINENNHRYYNQYQLKSFLTILECSQMQNYYKSNLNELFNYLKNIIKYFCMYLLSMNNDDGIPSNQSSDKTLNDFFLKILSNIKQIMNENSPSFEKLKKLFLTLILNDLTILLQIFEIQLLNVNVKFHQQKYMEIFELLISTTTTTSSATVTAETTSNQTNEENLPINSNNVIDKRNTKTDIQSQKQLIVDLLKNPNELIVINLKIIEQLLKIFKNNLSMQKFLIIHLFKTYFQIINSNMVCENPSEIIYSFAYIFKLLHRLQIQLNFNIKMNINGEDAEINDTVAAAAAAADDDVDDDIDQETDDEHIKFIIYLEKNIQILFNKYYREYFNEILILLIEILKYNPMILEHNIYKMLIFCMSSIDEAGDAADDDNELGKYNSWTNKNYCKCLSLILDMFSKLKRSEKFISHFLSSLNTELLLENSCFNGKPLKNDKSQQNGNKRKRLSMDINDTITDKRDMDGTRKKKKRKLINENINYYENIDKNLLDKLFVLYLNYKNDQKTDDKQLNELNNLDNINTNNNWPSIELAWPFEVRIKFTQFIQSFPSIKQSFVIWNTLIYKLNECLQLNFKNININLSSSTSSSSELSEPEQNGGAAGGHDIAKNELSKLQYKNILFYIDILCSLLSSYFLSFRITNINDPDLIKSIFKYRQLTYKTLRTFGLCILNREHNRRLMNAFLQFAINFGNFELYYLYYQSSNGLRMLIENKQIINISDNENVIDNDNSAPSITNPPDCSVIGNRNTINIINSYLKQSEWTLIEQRIKNFGQSRCKYNLNEIHLQRIITIKLFNCECIYNDNNNNKNNYIQDQSNNDHQLNNNNNNDDTINNTINNTISNNNNNDNCKICSNNMTMLIKQILSNVTVYDKYFLNPLINEMFSREFFKKYTSIVNEEYFTKTLQTLLNSTVFLQIFKANINNKEFLVNILLMCIKNIQSLDRNSNILSNINVTEFQQQQQQPHTQFNYENQYRVIVDDIENFIKKESTLRVKINDKHLSEYRNQILNILLLINELSFNSNDLQLKKFILFINLSIFFNIKMILLNEKATFDEWTPVIETSFKIFEKLMYFSPSPNIFEYMDINVLIELFECSTTVLNESKRKLFQIIFQRNDEVMMLSSEQTTHSTMFESFITLIKNEKNNYEYLKIGNIILESTAQKKELKHLYKKYCKVIMHRIGKYFKKLENTTEITVADKAFVNQTLSGFSLIMNSKLLELNQSENKEIDENFIRICKFYIGNSINCINLNSLKLINSALNHKNLIVFTNLEITLIIMEYWKNFIEWIRQIPPNSTIKFSIDSIESIALQSTLKFIFDNLKPDDIQQIFNEIEKEIYNNDINKFITNTSIILKLISVCKLNKIVSKKYCSFFHRFTLYMNIKLNKYKTNDENLYYSIVNCLLECQRAIISAHQFPLTYEMLDNILIFLSQLQLTSTVRITQTNSIVIGQLLEHITYVCFGLIRRETFIVDRIPQFVGLLKELLYKICFYTVINDTNNRNIEINKSDVDDDDTLINNELNQLVKITDNVKGIIEELIKHKKHVKMIGPYLLIYIINLMTTHNRRSMILQKNIKDHFNMICIHLISICDHRSSPFILRAFSLNDAGKQLYTSYMKEYTTVYKFKGKI